jgi:hypothetical protein
MARKIFFTGIFISIIASIFVILPQVSARTIIPTNVVIDEATRQTVLNATIKISFFAPKVDENDQPVVNVVNGEQVVVYTGGTGLGTVVNQNGQTIIVTHDHWTLIDNPQAIVELANAQGDLLLTMNGPEFGALVSYRDGGTTIVNMPASIAGHFAPANSNSAGTIELNDVLVIAYRNEDDSVSVGATVVSEMNEYDGKELIEMTSVDGEIVNRGNSGGGVFVNGQLVANMWATVQVQDNDSDDVRSTEMSRAALLPAGF